MPRRKSPKTLTVKEQAFVEALLIHGNVSRAFREAGYRGAPNEGGYKLVRKPHIAAFVAAARAERSRQNAITADDVLREVAGLAHSDITHYVIDDDGNIELAEGAPPGAMRAVSTLKRKVRSFVLGKGEEAQEVKEVSVELKLWDKPASVRMAGSHLGLWDECGVPPGRQIVIVDPYALPKGKEPRK